MKYITSESVSEGHPDKVCDQISDAILDEYLKLDSNAKVACETMITEGMVIVTGEISSSTNEKVDVEKIVRQVLKKIGYNSTETGIDADGCAVLVQLKQQSKDISIGVNLGKKKVGAGDQGMMFGYATSENKEFLPTSLVLAHKLTKRIDELRHEKILDYLRPDSKSQVVVEYKDGRPHRIDSIVVSAQHSEEVSLEELKWDLRKYLIAYIIPIKLVDEKTKIYINPTGRFVIGGPKGDAGLTGRKIIVDTYGGVARHGGGAFSGKDPTKVDRSGAYAARWVAKNIVAAKLVERAEVQISYGIGISEPLAIDIETFGTEKIPKEDIIEIIKKIFDLSPYGIIKSLNLKQPMYKKTSVYGHFGRNDVVFPWEQLNKANKIIKLANKMGHEIEV